MILSTEQILEIVKGLSEQTPDWIIDARKNSEVYNALVTGEKFTDLLIDKIEHIESVKKQAARKKYSKDIRDLFERVMKPRDNVFQSNGGSIKINISNENIKRMFLDIQSNFKSNKSVFNYLSDNLFKLRDVDPNGVLFLEYSEDAKLYPTYKSSKDIIDYEPNGQKLEYIVFKPEEVVEQGGSVKKYWRIVDDLNDTIVLEYMGSFFILAEKSFKHPFGETPGLILSEREKIGSKIRYTDIDKIIELSKDYARDKSILNIYKFQKGFPIHWRFVSQCRTCTGIGKISGNECTACDGHGYIRNQDVTDIVTIPIPDIDQPNIAPNIAGFVAPDLETWKQYKEDLISLEKVMKDTIWGTNLYTTQTAKLQETETATGRYIDVQPIVNVLNVYADAVEYIDNTLSNWIINFVDPIKKKNKQDYIRTYGRRFIIENPDIILNKYQEAKKTSDSSTVLDKLLEEFILSKYKNDHGMQETMLKKMSVEPFVHMTVEQIKTNFGSEETLKKELFSKFWSTCDTTLTVQQLKEGFNTFFESEKSKYKIDEPTKEINLKQ